MIEFSEDEVSSDLLLEAAKFADNYYGIDRDGDEGMLLDDARDAVFDDYRTDGEEWKSLVVGYAAGALSRGKKETAE